MSMWRRFKWHLMFSLRTKSLLNYLNVISRKDSNDKYYWRKEYLKVEGLCKHSLIFKTLHRWGIYEKLRVWIIRFQNSGQTGCIVSITICRSLQQTVLASPLAMKTHVSSLAFRPSPLWVPARALLFQSPGTRLTRTKDSRCPCCQSLQRPGTSNLSLPPQPSLPYQILSHHSWFWHSFSVCFSQTFALV